MTKSQKHKQQLQAARAGLKLFYENSLILTSYEDLQNYLNSIRRDFADKALTEEAVNKNPFNQFETWFEEAVNSQILDPYAMSVSTVSANGQPSIRIVYLRFISEEGLVFYTNYDSQKGNDIKDNNKVAINFFWGELERQIRVEGDVTIVSEDISNDYFSKRPRESQIGAWASDQSTVIKNREELEKRVEYFTEKYKDQEIPRPPHWGGYIVKPQTFEFWQGRPSRLHDRLIYTRDNDNWVVSRVAP